MCDSTSFYPTPMKIHQSFWIHWPFFSKTWNENTSKYVNAMTFFVKKTWTKGHWLLDDLWPQVCWGHMCDSTQGSLCLSPMAIHQSMWIQGLFFFQKLERSWTPRWPLTPKSVEVTLGLYQSIIVSKSHEKTLKYVDTVTFLSKNLNQKVIDS